MKNTVQRLLFKCLQRRNIAICCVILLVFSLLPLFVLSFYNHPCSDDYNYGLYASQALRESGSLPAVLSAAARKTAETFQNWQGTFSAVFLMALHPAVFGEELYAFTAFFTIGSLLFATFFFLKNLCVKALHMPMTDYLITASAVSFFSIQFAPSAFEGFFWFNGAVFYTFFHAIMLCLFAFLLKLFLAPTKKRAIPVAIAAALLAFYLGGGNYPTALLAFVTLLLATAWAFWKKLPLYKRVSFSACLVLELAALTASMLAPGNAVRQSYFATKPGAIESIILALGSAVRFITKHSTFPFLLALLLLVPLFSRCGAKLAFRFPLPLLAPVASVCVLGILMTPPIYAMSNTGAARMDDLYYFAYILLATANVFYFSGWFAHRFPWKKAVSPSSVPVFVLSVGLMFCASLVCMANLSSVSCVSALLSLKNGEAQAYHAQINSQLSQLQDSNVSDVVLEPVTARPALLFPSGVPSLTEDPENSVNKRVATYYGKNSVRIKLPEKTE